MPANSFVTSGPVSPTSWLTSASPWKMRFVAVAIGAAVFVIVGAADWLMYQAGIAPFGIMLGSDAVAAMLAFGFAQRLMNQAKQRRDMVRQQLHVIGESNHHIRNALELIQFSAQSTHDQKVIEQISMGVDRIQWVLRELLGDITFGEKLPEAKPPEAGNHIIH